MKKILVVSIMFVSLSLVACAAKKNELKTSSEKLSYAVGMDIGGLLKQLKEDEEDIDLDIFFQAVEDTLKEKETLLTPEQVDEVKKDFAERMKEERTLKTKTLAEKNLKEGERFFAENKKKKGVVTSESGLQYIVLSEGDGARPKASDKVKVHYKGALIDGTEFDSSYKRGEPTAFPVKGVIPGWTEALQLMKVGSKYRLFIPSNLAYGQRGAGPEIGPNATLIFEVELLSIEK